MGNSQFDDLLTLLGTGKWNMLYFVTAGSWFLIIPSNVFSGVYLAPNVGHTCLPPKDVHVTEISEDSCSYNIQETANTSDVVMETRACTQWTYDTSIYASTLTSEFNLVCDRSFLRATYQSMTSLASIFSAALVGYLADRYGRKTLVSVNTTLFGLVCIAMAFATDFTWILTLRFLQGAFSQATLYVLSLEVCEVKHRSLVGIVTGLPWAFGTMAWGSIAYLIRDWRYLQLAVSLPYLCLLPSIYMLDESPRWLILKGHHARALKVLKRAARWNKVEIPPDHKLKEMFLNIQKEQAEAEMLPQKCQEMKKETRRVLTMPKLLSTSKIRLVMAMLSINIFISALVFCGLSLSGNNYSADPFLYIVISGLVDVPSNTITIPLISWLGRKKPTVIGYSISGLTILALTFIPSDISWLVFTLAMVGKMCNSASFMIMFVYMSELFPTEVRLQGTGSTMTFSSVGAIVAPYITYYLGPLIPWLPSVIFGLSSFVAALVLLPLPETLGKPMLETIDDMEDAYKRPSKQRGVLLAPREDMLLANQDV